MSTRLSLLLLAGAFALLCAIVLLTLPATEPLSTQLDARQEREPAPLHPDAVQPCTDVSRGACNGLPVLPASRDAPQRRCLDPFRSDCHEGPSIRPAATRR
jgi:hypothetical protein